ncbi:MFS transporter, partial [Pseudomonas caricapapayae]
MRTRTLEGAASLVTPSRKRFFIMVLLFITVVINYLDRSNLSIAAPALTSELGLDPVHIGLIFSAFGWTYAAMQLPGGWLVDRVPPRILYT